MSDEQTSFYMRASAWIKEDEPDAVKIEDAYRKMRAKIQRAEGINPDDADSCLELLLESYGRAGGDADALYQSEEDRIGEPSIQVNSAQCAAFDTSSLYAVSDEPVRVLCQEEKLAEFNKLRRMLGVKKSA